MATPQAIESLPIPGFHAVIPAGGAGTRLWPLSRRSHPKFLHDLTGSGRTLLQATWDRLAPVSGPDGIVVVTGMAHERAVRDQLPGLTADSLLAEPSPRDSMAAIGLAAAVLRHRHGDEVILGSFAADHVIHGQAEFTTAVGEAVAAARAGYVVTIGIAAREPSTAFGYIEVGDDLGVPGAPRARHVVAFTEKPDAVTAAAYLETGRYRWNAGMFVVSARVLADHLAERHPRLQEGLDTIAAAWDTDEREAVLAREWPALTRIAIDHAVAEPVAAAGGVAVVPGDFGWDDVGDWASLADLLPARPDGARVLGDGDAAQVLDAPGALVVPAGKRLVAVLGLPDVVVVDTPDAVLVASRAVAQRVKNMVDALPGLGRDDLR
jgi:mannose-1-phosphate guanylyltransferase